VVALDRELGTGSGHNRRACAAYTACARASVSVIDEAGGFPVLNLKVFSYKELHLATRGFSEKIGHGGFGTVFQGKILDSTTHVAVKRLERPSDTHTQRERERERESEREREREREREFQEEVCTIGNILHLNLVRVGFCSENSDSWLMVRTIRYISFFFFLFSN
jgi:hypothetical protein